MSAETQESRFTMSQDVVLAVILGPVPAENCVLNKFLLNMFFTFLNTQKLQYNVDLFALFFFSVSLYQPFLFVHMRALSLMKEKGK